MRKVTLVKLVAYVSGVESGRSFHVNSEFFVTDSRGGVEGDSVIDLLAGVMVYLEDQGVVIPAVYSPSLIGRALEFVGPLWARFVCLLGGPPQAGRP